MPVAFERDITVLRDTMMYRERKGYGEFSRCSVARGVAGFLFSFVTAPRAFLFQSGLLSLPRCVGVARNMVLGRKDGG